LSDQLAAEATAAEAAAATKAADAAAAGLRIRLDDTVGEYAAAGVYFCIFI
jgi:hypothetical protein